MKRSHGHACSSENTTRRSSKMSASRSGPSIVVDMLALSSAGWPSRWLVWQASKRRWCGPNDPRPNNRHNDRDSKTRFQSANMAAHHVLESACTCTHWAGRRTSRRMGAAHVRIELQVCARPACVRVLTHRSLVRRSCSSSNATCWTRS